MSRPTASPPPEKASGPNDDHRASQATTTSVKDAPARRVPADLALVRNLLPAIVASTCIIVGAGRRVRALHAGHCPRDCSSGAWSLAGRTLA